MSLLYLFIYLLSMMLIVLGSLGFISALKIPGTGRACLACLAACVPVLFGIWFLRSAGLRPWDLDNLLQDSTRELKQVMQSAEQKRALYDEIYKMTQ